LTYLAISSGSVHSMDVLNVKKIINVNKHVYCEKNIKHWETLIINVDIFQMVCKPCSEYICSSCKFKIPVRWCSSQQNSFRNSCYKI